MGNKNKYEPQFKELRFENQSAFKIWLLNQTYKIIDFEHHGQDLSRIWIHKSGEILHCDFQGAIWNGRFVKLDKINVGDDLKLWSIEYLSWQVMTFRVESVNEVKP